MSKRIIDVLSERGVSFKVVSGGSQALVSDCPWCAEGKAPKLYLNLETGSWICFRCEERGRLVRFLEAVLGMDPFEARHVASRLNLLKRDGFAPQPREAPAPLPPVNLPKGYRQVGDRRLLSFEHSYEVRVIQYLESRGISPFTAVRYGMGFSSKKTISDRVIIPVKTEGELRAVVMRSVHDHCPGCGDDPCSCDKEWAKVLYTVGSRPHMALFNYDNLAGDTCVLVEGVFDALRLPELACATLGTNVSAYQRNLLRAFRRVILLWDGDGPGRQAAARVGQQLAAAMIPTHTAHLPAGTDPADCSEETLKLVLDGATETHLLATTARV